MSTTATFDVGRVVAAVREAIGQSESFALLHGPTLEGNAWDYVKQCIDTGWVSSAGEFVSRFEGDLARATGARFAVATVNGTAALHIALMLAGVERQEEVLIPSLTFVATANAVSYTGAVPHFVDVSETTLGIDPDKLAEHLAEVADLRDGQCVNRRTGRRIAAIVPMHTFGHPVDLDRLVEVAAEWQLPVVEDAAESLGSWHRDRHTGTIGRLGIFSFNGNKIITTGGGGMIVTEDEELATLARHLTTTAKKPHTWQFIHDRVGYNYRLPNLNAALGCAQLEMLDEFLERKRRLAERYAAAIDPIEGLATFHEPPHARSNYWLNAILLDRADAALRDELLAALNEAGLQSRPIWTPMHQLPMYAQCPRMSLPVTEDLADRVINVPSSAIALPG